MILRQENLFQPCRAFTQGTRGGGRPGLTPTTGMPEAMASSTTKPRVSLSDGMMNISADAKACHRGSPERRPCRREHTTASQCASTQRTQGAKASKDSIPRHHTVMKTTLQPPCEGITGGSDAYRKDSVGACKDFLELLCVGPLPNNSKPQVWVRFKDRTEIL